MKRLVFLSLVLSTLSGCAIVDAFLMTKYDPNEYKIITQIRTDASQYKTECDNPLLNQVNAISIANKTVLFQNYSEHIPYNDDGFKASKSLNAQAQGLAESYAKGATPSSLFCKIKYSGIENSATIIQHTIGNKPR
ncbi:hypothetical protein UFOVP71_456 [uncultured Caudovirales phage]|uniref:Lipoprotein n=1 Tax=uncultured Caudovirales phage TaxID=2100421 RepID=A0A6J5TAG4_9CAUD|nr:hypothetical protein UFOVP71_456 [uncultured Caudovirales phage]